MPIMPYVWWVQHEVNTRVEMLPILLGPYSFPDRTVHLGEIAVCFERHTSTSTTSTLFRYVIGCPQEVLTWLRRNHTSVLDRVLVALSDVTCDHCTHPVAECGCPWCSSCSRRVDSVCSNCEQCDQNGQDICCTCRVCPGDHRTQNDFCGDCDFCDSCCECVRCESCNRRNVRICSQCNQCNRCCSGCGSTVSFFTNPLVFHIPRLHERVRNPSSRFLAAEIEVAGIEAESGDLVTRAVEKWKGSIVEDGSLPNDGFEINTAPAGGDKFVEEIEDICKALKRVQAHVTSACGLHVHIDARDFDYFDIRRLALVYADMETALFQMVSKKRRENTYCTPCGDIFRETILKGRIPYKEVKQSVQVSLYGSNGVKDVHRNRKSKNTGPRYRALNLHSWFYRGTVECRLFGGTVKAEKIIPWGMMWARIFDWVHSHTDDEVMARFSGLRTPKNKLLAVVGKETPIGQFVKDRMAMCNRSSQDGQYGEDDA